MGLSSWQQSLKSVETTVDDAMASANSSGALGPLMMLGMLALLLLLPEAELPALLPELGTDAFVDTSGVANPALDPSLAPEELARNQFVSDQAGDMLTPSQYESELADQAAERAAIRKGTFGA